MRLQSAQHRFRSFLLVVLLLVGLWAAAWGTASLLAPRLIGEAIAGLEAQLHGTGVQLGDLSVSAIRISPWLLGVELRGLRARLDLDPYDRINLSSEVLIDALELRLTDPLKLRGRLRAQGVEVRLDPSDRPTALPFDRFANANATLGNLPLAHPRETADAIRTKLRELFIENQATGDVDFNGDVSLDVDGAEFIAHLYTERDQDRFRLRFRASDIQRISDAKGLGLAPEQVEIVSDYPLRTPVIMLLTDQARDLAQHYAPDDVWLQDAHRHVTWSFLLTRAFGPEFATKATDAQEMRPGNTPNERAMDYHNNAIGRRLVAEGVALSALPQRVREDPDIIRHPDKVDEFGESRLLR